MFKKAISGQKFQFKFNSNRLSGGNTTDILLFYRQIVLKREQNHKYIRR